ncbi:thioredoxin family protein [Pseudovibrio denitrificans]|uniref:thioredoxin family protein n=1 Tax=Pseudovibrio denitrificans TaxID=258256 RepID=UPI0039BF0422
MEGAPDFTLKDADGQGFTMSEHIGENGLLIAFICNHCLYVQAIGDRLAADTKLLMSEGFGVLAVMSNDYKSVPADSPAKTEEFAEFYGFEFPCLIDEDQTVGKTHGAVCTSDFFGLNNKGELQYRGCLDDSGFNDSTGRTLELLNTRRLIAKTDSGPKDQVPNMRCSIN